MKAKANRPTKCNDEVQESGVYISGQGASLNEALEQALAENGSGAKQRFWVIVSGNDIVQVTEAGISGDIRELLQRIRERRGLVYVCQTDLAIYGIKESDLISGVKSIHGFSADAASNGQKQRGIELPKSVTQARLILRTCADRDEPGH